MTEVCTYPRCKCMCSTSTSQPEPTCPHGYLKEGEVLVWRFAGHEFKRMGTDDFLGFAGAEEGSFICYPDTMVLILNPQGTQLAVITAETGDEVTLDLGSLERDRHHLGRLS